MKNMNDWKEVILKQSDTIEMAIQVLNTVSLRIVLIVDDSESLVGTVTDGDIRRALVDHYQMDAMLSEIMFKEPITALASETQKNILAMMKEKDILQVPIIDQNHKIIGLEVIHHILEKNKYDNPVFLMAGGFGLRLQPITNNIPKPLLRIDGKPLLESILNQFVDAGFHNFYISIHYKADMIRNYFGDGKKWNVSIKYVYEESPLGTAGALGLLPSDLSKLPIIMMNGDLLTNVDLVSLLKFHNEQDGVATMCVTEYDFQVPYGVVESSKQKVVSISEKPIQKFFINAGIYVLDNSLQKNVDGKSYIDMPSLLKKQIKENKTINMFPIHEYWLDIGQIEQLEKAKIEVKNFLK